MVGCGTGEGTLRLYKDKFSSIEAGYWAIRVVGWAEKASPLAGDWMIKLPELLAIA